ncbi:nitrous oxide-stimulated promoter family protein [Photobacterium sp. DNB22_13_2]
MIVQTSGPARQQRELDTAKAMIRLYCKTLHRGAIMCPECEGLIEYVEHRVQKCRLGNEKPNCNQCKSNCYQPAKRLHFNHVSRWAMPKLVWRRPFQILKFKFDCLRRGEPVDTSSSSLQQ